MHSALAISDTSRTSIMSKPIFAKSMTHHTQLLKSGHERIDVVKYRNESFIPEIMQHRTRLRAYQVGDVDVELEVEEQSDGQGGHLPPLVLVAHDASIFHANDDQAQRWVYKDEYRLKHKGKGRGLHASEFICSTVGHLKDAGHVIDMGKNHDGYWTGEDVVKQVTPSLKLPDQVIDNSPLGTRKGNTCLRGCSSATASLVFVR